MEAVLVGRLHTAGSILVSILSDELVEVFHHAPLPLPELGWEESDSERNL